MAEATIKDKPEKKAPKDKKEKPPSTSKITVTSDGDYMIIRMPRRLAIEQLLNG